MTCAVQERTEKPEMDLRTLAEGLELPDGYRAEIITGSIIVSPTPTYRHALIVKAIERVLDGADCPDLLALQMVTVEVAESDDRYVPDLVVLPAPVAHGEDWDGPDWIRPADELELAVEVVSPRSKAYDWEIKVRGYARAGVPLYLVVDQRKSEIALFSEPENGDYRKVTRAVRGASVHLPEPFDIEVEATALLL